MDERFYTPKQVAEILQVHQYTVLKWIREGKLRALKFGRVYRTTESELKAFLGQTAHDSAQDIVRAAAQSGLPDRRSLAEVTLPIPERIYTPEATETTEAQAAPAQQAYQPAYQPQYSQPAYNPQFQQAYAPQYQQSYPQQYQQPYQQATAQDQAYSLPLPPNNQEFAPPPDQIYSINIEP